MNVGLSTAVLACRWILQTVNCSLTGFAWHELLLLVSLEFHHGHVALSRVSGVHEVIACYLCVCLFYFICLFNLFFFIYVGSSHHHGVARVSPFYLTPSCPLTSLKLSLFSHKDKMFYAQPELFCFFFSLPKHRISHSPRSPFVGKWCWRPTCVPKGMHHVVHVISGEGS